jgi:hypothetical protein
MGEKIVAEYVEGRVKRLRLSGPFIREAISEVILKFRPYTFSPEDSKQEWKGEASFLVESEEDCPGLIRKMEPGLAKMGYEIGYRGGAKAPG